MSDAPATSFDAIVFGGGAPGEHCAGAIAEGGLGVAVVERERFGGECSFWACIPSKTLLRPGEAVAGARGAGAHAQVDVKAALAWRDYIVNDYSDSSEVRWLSDRGITTVRGTGKLAGPGAIDVDGVRYTAPNIVIATGASPFVPPVDGLRGLEGIWSTREATGMKEVPRHMLVLGGGAAGVELAQVVRRFGGDVTIVEMSDRVLSREAEPLGKALAAELQKDGIELALSTTAVSAHREGATFRLQLDDGRTLEGDRLLVATGRRPRVEGIGLESVGVEPNPHGIAVDASLRVADGLWAIGDVTGILQLTHVGEYQGDVVASNILGEAREAHYEAVPRVTYTDPQAAAVGVGEAAFAGTAALSGVSKAATYTHDYAESKGFLTLLSDGEVITGAYALGPEAGEWLQQATLAIRARVPLEILRDVIQPFPSFSDIYEAALKDLRRAIAGAHPGAATPLR